MSRWYRIIAFDEARGRHRAFGVEAHTQDRAAEIAEAEFALEDLACRIVGISYEGNFDGLPPSAYPTAPMLMLEAKPNPLPGEERR